MEYYGKYDSPTGPLLLVSDGEALTGVYFGRDIPAELTRLPVFDRADHWLEAYFRGDPPPIDFPIRAEGTAFQKLVWDALLQIPYGSTRTYGQIAREAAAALGKEKMSAQAVGQAVGRNPISILIPCHRVVGADRSLTGYTGGLENKLWLLRHEGWTVEHSRISESKE